MMFLDVSNFFLDETNSVKMAISTNIPDMVTVPGIFVHSRKETGGTFHHHTAHKDQVYKSQTSRLKQILENLTGYSIFRGSAMRSA